MRASLTVGMLMLLLPGRGSGQDEFYHPELNWHTIETEHFLVHYHEGAERTGKVVAKVAEEIYGPVTSLYQHEPDQKVSFIIRDVDDISNGAAYFYENRIEILAPSMDFVFRGTHNWLRNVITHEFTHIVQIQTAMKFGRTVPAIYLQVLGYESERRPDVLYGYPNVIVSYPLSGFNVPVWFAEGVAQYNRAQLQYDSWDSHRDMILRSYVLDGSMLTWNEMSVFGKTSLGNESSYNAGFSFVSYIGRTYGDEKLNDISRALAGAVRVTIDAAIEQALGKTGEEVYEEWKASLERDYAVRVLPIRKDLVQGSLLQFEDELSADHPSRSQPSLEPETMRFSAGVANHVRMQPCCRAAVETGFANLHPRFSPDGEHFAFVSTGTSDYFGGSALYVADATSLSLTRIQGQVFTDMCWSPDGSQLYYGRPSRKNPHFSYQSDIYRYNLSTEREERITFGLRASSPSMSPDGRLMAFVVMKDGTSNLAMSSVDGREVRQLTDFKNGEQVYDPEWSPSGERILFDYSIRDGRDIAWVKNDGTGFEFLVTGDDDSRSAVFMPGGGAILFSSDRGGIFNLYSLELTTRSLEQRTNVLGGAFMPTVSVSGDIVYAGYISRGYKLFHLKAGTPTPDGNQRYLPATVVEAMGPSADIASTSPSPDKDRFDWNALRSYDDSQTPSFAKRPYKSTYTSLTVVPFLRLDNYNTSNTAVENIKPGAYVFANDVLDRTGLFAGAALNSRLEVDLFAQFHYRGKLPGFYQLGLEPASAAEVYYVTRKTDTFLYLPLDTIGVGVTYNLLEFDFVLHHPLVSPWPEVEFRYIHSRYTSNLSSFVLPETGELVPASSDLYLIGNAFQFNLVSRAILRSRHQDINPIGRTVRLSFARELNKFNGDGEYEVTSTGLVPKYKDVNFTRVELGWKEHIGLFGLHTLTGAFRVASILGPAVDEFFDFYAGGLVGMKGYPYYSLGGNELLAVGLTYRFPILDNIDLRFFNIHLDKLYASVYGDIGDAWTGNIPSFKEFKSDAGMEIRLETFSWYSYPTRIFFNASYGFDTFSKFIGDRNEVVTYGKEWRFYFGVLFGFDFD